LIRRVARAAASNRNMPVSLARVESHPAGPHGICRNHAFRSHTQLIALLRTATLEIDAELTYRYGGFLTHCYKEISNVRDK